jgi:hypothetical protein
MFMNTAINYGWCPSDLVTRTRTYAAGTLLFPGSTILGKLLSHAIRHKHDHHLLLALLPFAFIASGCGILHGVREDSRPWDRPAKADEAQNVQGSSWLDNIASDHTP